MSRFHRAAIPSPKSYLAGMRLLHAAFLFQNPGLSVSDVAYRMDYSSPQSFGRICGPSSASRQESSAVAFPSILL